jgi:hypothetical protein
MQQKQHGRIFRAGFAIEDLSPRRTAAERWCVASLMNFIVQPPVFCRAAVTRRWHARQPGRITWISDVSGTASALHGRPDRPVKGN